MTTIFTNIQYLPNAQLHGQESLVLLMAFDYQDKTFSLKIPRDASENIPSLVLKVGEALSKHRVRLNAALARMRVKSNAQTTSQLLSEASYVKYQAIVTEPFYCRVNNKRAKNVQTEIVSSLIDDGFKICSSKEELQRGEKLFCRIHSDLLAFSSDARETLLQHQLLSEGYIVPQVNHFMETTYINVIIIWDTYIMGQEKVTHKIVRCLYFMFTVTF